MLLPIALFAQNDEDSLQSYFAAVPLIYRTPETSWAFGAGAAYNFYTKSDKPGNNPSQLQLGAVYTLEKQLLLYLPYQLYFGDNRYNFNGELGYYYYFYRYYGIGNATDINKEELYLASYPRFRWEGLYRVFQNMYAGFTYDYDNYQILETKDNGLLQMNQPTAYSGGVVSEPGIKIYYDSRDHIFYPSDGYFLQADIYTGMNSLGSVSNYRGVKLDVTKYSTLPWDHILAAQLVWENQKGEVPFFQLALLGGPKLLRGYIEGRFRDKNLSLMQLEYRIPLFWRFKMVVFGAYGAVDDKIVLPLVNGHWSFGGGLRILADRENRLHLRIDYALGSDQSGFYLTIGEAF